MPELVWIIDIFMYVHGLYRQVNVFERTQAYYLNVQYNKIKQLNKIVTAYD